MSKIEPAVQTLYFRTPTVAPGAIGTFYVDLSQTASLVNRRFYRQGINWAVAGFKFFSNSGNLASLSVTKLPNTWVMSNAWEKSMRMWMKMNMEALSTTESVRPKFLDFKIYADATHHTLGFGANLLPRDFSAVPADYIAGEWESSKVVIPIGTAQPGQTSDREIIAVGANFPGFGASGLDAVSAIEGYAASRGLPNVLDPNAPADAASVDGFNPANWMAAIFNEGTDQTEDVLEDMITENNVAPYPFENGPIQGGAGLIHTDTQYPGGANQAPSLQLHDIDSITATTIGGQTRIKGGNFPCGLVRIDIQNQGAETTGYAFTLDLIPGTHRGYLCEPMTEM